MIIFAAGTSAHIGSYDVRLWLINTKNYHYITFLLFGAFLRLTPRHQS